MFDLHLPSQTLRLDPPIVMGVVNVTPDSFSDGGRFRDPDLAVAHGLSLAAQGAAIVDVGGESTRPGAEPVGVEEELRRVLRVIDGLVARHIVVSVDTRHAPVAQRALDHGASIINDISGLRDPAMRSLAARAGVPVVIMHMPNDDPATMQQFARYGDVVADVVGALRRQIATAQAAGVEQIIVDPGIGFGKTTAHNLALIRRLDEIAALGRPVMVGVSRKRFIGQITGDDEPSGRLAGTLAANLAAVARGAHIIRVHEVAPHVHALRMWRALNE
ncbi:MAG: dihydropteroate synthase [Ilumatobacteraceae bacterium]|nr:dihydropteroate synthase [Ilumatobacteraceae bacterium]